jgi:hypothetical protein
MGIALTAKGETPERPFRDFQLLEQRYSMEGSIGELEGKSDDF